MENKFYTVGLEYIQYIQRIGFSINGYFSEKNGSDKIKKGRLQLYSTKNNVRIDLKQRMTTVLLKFHDLILSLQNDSDAGLVCSANGNVLMEG